MTICEYISELTQLVSKLVHLTHTGPGVGQPKFFRSVVGGKWMGQPTYILAVCGGPYSYRESAKHVDPVVAHGNFAHDILVTNTTISQNLAFLVDKTILV